MDSTRIPKSPPSGITSETTTTKDSLASIQEQKKLQAGIAEAKDSVEIKRDDALFGVDQTKGQVRFGDGIQGKIPGESVSNTIKAQESVPATRGNYLSGKTLSASDFTLEQKALRDKRKLDTAEPAIKPSITEFPGGGSDVDPNALVQYVLRESYLQTTEDLRFYAEKVKYFNEVKKDVREYLESMKNGDAAEKLRELAPGKIENTMEVISSAIRESIQDTNENKKHYLNLLQDLNKISSEISDHARSIFDASARVSAKKKDDDDP